eukprot:323987_1
MKRSLCNKKLFAKSNTIQYKLFSTAFDPYHYLHSDTVQKQQRESFARVWDKNPNNFKEFLTPSEIELFETKVAQTKCFDDFYAKMKELYSPRRHDAIRNTRTWQLCHTQVEKYNNNSDNNEGIINIIFGNDEIFLNEFKNKYLNPNKILSELLWDFSFADLRFMCALQAINIYGGPSLTAIFGNRNNYHYNIPDPNGHSAYWLNCLYDKITSHDLVLVSCLSAIKENKPINQIYFKDKLNSLETNAMKEETWKVYAVEFSKIDTIHFMDKLDRAFVAFQTDYGVSELRPRFTVSDID